jgi:hypothetical protein
MVPAMTCRSSARRLTCLMVLASCLGGAPALAKDGDDDDGRREARVGVTCSKGATGQLRLRSRDGTIRLEFEVRRRRSGEAWRVVIVHERRVEWRQTLRTRGSSGSIRVRRTLDDLDGPDRVTARASGPRGLTCEASAKLAA